MKQKKQNHFQNFANANHLNIPLESNSLDGIWAHASLHHMDSHDSFEKAVIEFNMILQMGGILHLATQAQTGFLSSKVVLDSLTNHERFYIYFTEDKLKDLLERSGFQILSMDHFGETDKKVNAGRSNVEWLVALAKKIKNID